MDEADHDRPVAELVARVGGGAVILDAAGCPGCWNEAARAIFGYHAHEFGGRWPAT